MEKVVIGDAELYCGDCRDVLPTMGHVDALVTDPPYGIGEAAGKNKSRSHLAKSTDYGNDAWDDKPIAGDLIQALRDATSTQIIFGGNYYDLPPTSCWLVWDKDNGNADFADCELAWTNMKCAVRRIKWRWNGFLQEDMKRKEKRVHPTQKPVPVMRWCIERIKANPQAILDPFMGSGTTGVACVQLGRKFIGIEKERKYFDIACRRIQEAYDALPSFL